MVADPYDGTRLLSEQKSRAIVLVMENDRYFYGFGEKGQVLTAWSLAGARLFGGWGSESLIDIEARLKKAGKKPLRSFVGLTSDLERHKERLEAAVDGLIEAGDGLTGCMPSEKDWHDATEKWEKAKSKAAPF